MPNLTELDLLRAVRTRLSDPARWTQHESARTQGGQPCGAGEASAACWCVSGALGIEAQDASTAVRRRAILCLNYQADQHGYSDAIYLNDGTNHAMVLAMIDAAMETGEVAL